MNHLRSCAAAALAIGLAAASAQATPSIDLGLAGDYAAFATNGVAMTISSGNTVVNGNVALGPATSVTFSGGGLITGRLDVHNGSPVTISGGSFVTGGTHSMDMTAADAHAALASAAALGLAPTVTVAGLTNGDMLSGSGGLNVVNILDDIALSGGTLTLSGSATDTFVINVFGDFQLSGGAAIDLVGIDASQVLFNVVGAGDGIDFTGNSTVNGTVLALQRDITVSGGIINGSVIGGDSFLKLQSGPTVNHVAFQQQQVPGPSALALLGVAGIAARRRRRR